MAGVDILLDADTMFRELDVLQRRRDEAIEVLLQQLSEVWHPVEETYSELDDLLAESEHPLVSEAVDRAVGLIEAAAENWTFEELTRLVSVDLPGGWTLPAGAAEPPGPPPARKPAELPTSDTVDWERVKDRDDFPALLTNWVNDCAQQIRYLLKYFCYELWPHVLRIANAGDFQKAQAAASECEEVAHELRDAFELWEMWLGQLYNVSPSSLGPVGEHIDAMASWWRGQESAGRCAAYLRTGSEG